MAKKRRKTKSSRKPFSLLGGKDSKRKKTKEARRGIGVFLKAFALVALVAMIPIGIAFMNQYVEEKVDTSGTTGVLQLVDAPTWITDAIKEQIYRAAHMAGEDLSIDEEVAATVQQNIATFVPWLENVNVQATHDSLLISGQWRRPLGMVDIGNKYYVDVNLVAMDYVPLDTLPIVEITGLATQRAPKPGTVWEKDDLAAAIDILHRLDWMDSLVAAENPLLYEIKSIDVSNYNGRNSRSKPHIELFARDGTKIIWGAEIDKWSEYLEVTDTEKIGRLYHFYKQNGSLLHTVQFINLCDPQDHIPQPIDEY